MYCWVTENQNNNEAHKEKNVRTMVTHKWNNTRMIMQRDKCLSGVR